MNEKIVLLCFPFGGAGISIFNGWNDLVGDNIEVVPMALPGRERLIDEEPYTDLNLAADDFARYIVETFRGRKVALFGHCFMGSVLAYEVVKRIEEADVLKIVGLFVSAAYTPDSHREYRLDFSDDDSFISAVEKLTGYKNDAFEIPELRELLLPSLKADFEMDMNYVNKNCKSVKTSIIAIYAEDDSFVSKDEVALWEKYTENDFSLHKVEGVHLYITDKKEDAISIIIKSLKEKSIF